jgi:hypothetical protein
MDDVDVGRWFDDYLLDFAACCRGESDTASLLDHYGVPLLVTTDDGYYPLTSDDQVVGMLDRQVTALRAAGYGSSEAVASEVWPVNAASALYRGTFARRRRDGTQIDRITATYLLAAGPAGPRISMLAVHGDRAT